MSIVVDKKQMSEMNEPNILDKARVKTALKLLNTHFPDPEFKVNTWALQMTMSVSNFSRLMRRETQQAPSVHIRDKRLQHAQHLLQTTDMPIMDIATICGFGDNNYFARKFKEILIVSPTVWRELHQKQ
jgi:transcriptional regulator GlxA family with amidase domain